MCLLSHVIHSSHSSWAMQHGQRPLVYPSRWTLRWHQNVMLSFVLSPCPCSNPFHIGHWSSSWREKNCSGRMGSIQSSKLESVHLSPLVMKQRCWMQLLRWEWMIVSGWCLTVTVAGLHLCGEGPFSCPFRALHGIIRSQHLRMSTLPGTVLEQPWNIHLSGCWRWGYPKNGVSCLATRWGIV